MAPATISEKPPKYLVHEFITKSAPNNNGDCKTGEQNVLSTIVMILCFLAKSQIFYISTTVSNGFVGVSKVIIFVLFLICFSIFDKSLKLTIEFSSPNFKSTLFISLFVPP